MGESCVRPVAGAVLVENADCQATYEPIPQAVSVGSNEIAQDREIDYVRSEVLVAVVMSSPNGSIERSHA